MTADSIAAQLHTQIFGHPLVFLPQVSSTNTVARSMAHDGAAEGTAVIATAQSAGRGRNDRAFYSPDGGVYLSVILRPHGMAAGDITTCAAIAVARAIERLCPVCAGVKWVNDVYIRGRKVCGILTEGVCAPDGTLAFAVLGIGINVAQTAFPADLPIATSLAMEGCRVTREAVIAAVLEEWERLYTAYDAAVIREESRRRSVVIGRTVTVHQGTDEYLATALDITEAGHLLLRTASGDVRELSSGEVRITL